MTLPITITEKKRVKFTEQKKKLHRTQQRDKKYIFIFSEFYGNFHIAE